MEIDTGLDKTIGLHSIVEHLRNNKGQDALKLLQKIRKDTFKNFMRNHTLKEAATFGFLPIDCVAENISWKQLRGYYAVKDILDWGMTFHIAIQMGLEPSNIGGNDGLSVLKEMGAEEHDMKTFLNTYHHIVQAKWSPETCKEAGFTFNDLINMGANAISIHKNSDNDWNIKTMVLAFDPTGPEWIEAGFDDKCIALWNSNNYRNFIATKTSLMIPKTVKHNLEGQNKDNENNYILQTNGQPKFVNLQL